MKHIIVLVLLLLRKENKMSDTTSKPLAAKGLTSYRYKGTYGYIMIGAKDDQDALSEAARSLSSGKAMLQWLEVWDGSKYVKVNSLS